MTGPTHRLTRRAFLGAAAASSVAAGTTACAVGERPLQVAVVWSGGELQRFRKVLAAYRDDTGRSARAISVGDDIDAFLRARQIAGTSPDVAILPRPGLVLDYARRGWLTPLSADSAASPGSSAPATGSASPRPAPASGTQQELLTEPLTHSNKRYGAWVKVAHKSLFWYRKDALPEGMLDSWDALVRQVKRLADETRGAHRQGALAIGAADGWVLTDWFENVLADVSTETYQDLAQGKICWNNDAVRETLRRLYELWRIPGAFPGGGQSALLTQFDGSVLQMLQGQAAMVFEGDFVEHIVTEFGDRQEVCWAPFPGQSTDTNPMIVGGDAAVVWRGSSYGADLAHWLSGEGAGILTDNGFPSPNAPTSCGWVAQIREAGKRAQFDLSDSLPAPFTGSDGTGIWRIMQDFFAAATSTGRERIPKADLITRTALRLDLAAEQAGRPR